MQNFFLCRRHCDTIKYIAVGLSYLCLSLSLPDQKSVGHWTIAEMSASVWTSSTSVQTFGAIIHPNSEYWQRIGQPYMRKPGRCFVAVVEIETDRCAVCLAELDTVHSEADRQAECPVNEGRQQTVSRRWSITNKIVSRETIAKLIVGSLPAEW